ncbi:MAG: LamG-like jellyroll fold domain-containing protein, partial [Tepidisphaeraceae bacterium]
IATLARNAASFTDASIVIGVEYTYRVVAISPGGDALATNEAIAKVQVAPTAPTGVTAAPISSRRIRIAWDAPPPLQDVTGFVIERGGLAIATVGNVTLFDDSGLEPGTNYTYRVRAINAAGQSPLSAPAAATTLLSDNALLGHWRFDDGGVSGGGSVASDSAGGGHHGALVNGPAWTGGNLGQAIGFDGVDDRVVIPDAASLRFGATQDFTLSAWVNLSSLPGQWTGIVTKARGSAGADWYGIWLDPSNRFVFGGSSNIIGSAVATTGGWIHVAAVQDGAAGTRALYVNGILVGSGAAQAASGVGAMWIGGAESMNEFFAGRIDDIRLAGRAVPAAELAALADPRVTLAGSGGDDQWTVRLSSDGERYEFFVNVLASGATTFTRPRDAVASIDVIGGDGADQLRLDFASGQPLPDYGFTFDGGSGIGDVLLVIGANVGDAFQVDGLSVRHGNVSIAHVNTETIDFSRGLFALDGDLAGRGLRVHGAAATFNITQRLSSLVVYAGGVIDVKDNDLILDYSMVSPIGIWVVGGGYNGLSGMVRDGRLMSSLATGDHFTTLGVAEASDALDLIGSATVTWSGRTVDASSVLVKFTYGGDADLDGKINIDDYGQIDFNVAASGSVFGWFVGDFNLDGKINIDDYGIIDFNVAAQGSPL